MKSPLHPPSTTTTTTTIQEGNLNDRTALNSNVTQRSEPDTGCKRFSVVKVTFVISEGEERATLYVRQSSQSVQCTLGSSGNPV